MRARELVVALSLLLGACGRLHQGDPAADGGQAATGKQLQAGRNGATSSGGIARQSSAASSGSAGQTSAASSGSAGQTSAASAGIDGQSSGGRSSSRPAPTQGGFCCPPDDSPGCCMSYGGFAETIEGCNSWACDGMPMPYEAWTKSEDAHGCPIWVEPVLWDHCCGCRNDQPCPIDGTWRIDFDGEPDPCGPSTSEVITISSDDDAGAREVTFQGRGPQPSTCPDDGRTGYSTEISTTDNSCIVSITSASRWCSGEAAGCGVLTLTLSLRGGDGSAVRGTYEACGCGAEVKTVGLTGRAYRVD